VIGVVRDGKIGVSMAGTVTQLTSRSESCTLNSIGGISVVIKRSLVLERLPRPSSSLLSAGSSFDERPRFLDLFIVVAVWRV